ncbi:MAG: hypothetical protein K8T26_11710 [Lentisphaerae bacterium]|nr:hypothetical protein [Lentisphaerota bacterium]
MRNAKLSWVVFVLVAGLMWYLRYGGGLHGKNLDLLIAYGPYSLLVLHVTLLLMAFQESVYQGILCLLVPLYSFYWLFMLTDAFLLRAVAAGLLVGIGQDSMAFYQDWFNEIVRVGKGWIESGGGDIESTRKWK